MSDCYLNETDLITISFKNVKYVETELLVIEAVCILWNGSIYLFIYLGLKNSQELQVFCLFCRDSGIFNIARSYSSSFFLWKLGIKVTELDFTVYTFQSANGCVSPIEI